MNYYRRYVGDYQRDTMHLSLVEHGVYSVLLDAYYSRDGKIPVSHAELFRLCRAFDPAEREAVAKISDEYFPINGDGTRHNKRADRELFVALPAIDRMREAGKVGANKRWAKNGAEMGNPIGNPIKNNGEPYRVAIEPPTSNHQPPTTTQNPPKTKTSTALSGKPDFTAQAVEILEYLNTNTKRTFRPVDTNLKLIVARLRSGVTPLQCREVIFAKCQQWQADPKMAEYLRPATLFNATKFEQYLGEQNAMS